jgi:tetratricopeptide (TPR) repeat protein
VQWSQQVQLLTAGDAALQRQDTAAAVTAFSALAAVWREGQHPLPSIDAAIGLGDAARQAGDVRGADRQYRRALSLARRCKARYAEFRAGLSLGYIQLQEISVQSAQESFRRAAEVAAQGDWRLERANALVALGECETRLLEVVTAHRHLLEALSIFESLSSRQGIGNACYQLGDACRRSKWISDARGWFHRALAVLDAGEHPIGRANALDGLAEVEAMLGNLPRARRLHGEGARISWSRGYERGFAHALQGLGNVACAAGNPAVALHKYSRARELYKKLVLPTAEADACTGIARAADMLNETQLELLARADAVNAIETARSQQVRDVDQEEYLRRLGHHYSLALTAAIRHGDLDLFIATFEALAGRRLAGLASFNPDCGSIDKARIVAQLARTSAEHQFAPTDPDPEKAFRRRIGAAALKVALPGLARDAFDDATAAAYTRFDLEAARGLWTRITSRHENLLLLTENHDNSRIFWLAIVGRGTSPHGGILDVQADALTLLSKLHRQGLSREARLTDLAPLRQLLPTEVLDLLPDTGEITILPAGRLWAVPWPAVLTTVNQSTMALGERFAMTQSPTLTMLDAPPPRDIPSESIAWWRSRQVINHQLTAFRGLADSPVAASLATGVQARAAVLQGIHDLFVLITHGRPMPEMIHSLDLDDGLALTPADFLDATPPRRLALIACWGAGVPGRRRSDPLSIATMAIVRGSQEVLATTSELIDDPVATRFVNNVLHASLSVSFAQAVHASTVRFLARPEYRDGPVARWAPLICLEVRYEHG